MTLGELFAGIANAIRSKDGTTAAIPATTFPERIMALSGGGGGGDGSAYVVNIPVNISASVSVTAEVYNPPKTHALYNGVRLPAFSSDILSQYSFMWIRLNKDGSTYDMIASNYKWYLKSGSLYVPRSTYSWYTATATSTEWTHKQTQTDGGPFSLPNGLTWSSYDIPNGSETATDIYFEGTEPVPTE